MQEENGLSRAGEKTLGIIGIVFNVLAVALLIFAIVGLGNVENDPEFRQMLEEQIASDPTLAEMGDTQSIIDGLMTGFDVIAWVLVALLIISTILALFAVARLGHNRKPKVAGVCFIVAGILAGVLSLTSILFYIAAIMCIVRKPRKRDGIQNEDGNHHGHERLRDQDSIRLEEERRHKNENLERERLREEERRRLEQQTHKEQTHQPDGDSLIERDDLKRRADVKLRKDNDKRPL